MRFGVLGPLEVRTADGRPAAVGEPKVRALLADLLVHAGQPVSTDRLLDDLWGDDLPGKPAAALQTKVWQLRRALDRAEAGGRTLVVSRAPGYLLDIGPDAVDARRFEDLTTASRAAADPERRAALLGDALALWRGPAYADFADATFARPAIQRLDELRLVALEELAEARLDLGEHRVLAGEYAELADEHPLRERLHAAHLRALYRAGRQSEALERYARLRDRLRDELGVDPGPELAAVYQAILVQDPSLDAAPSATRRPPHRGHARGVALTAPTGPAAEGDARDASIVSGAPMTDASTADAVRRALGGSAAGEATRAGSGSGTASGDFGDFGPSRLGPAEPAPAERTLPPAAPPARGNLPLALADLYGRDDELAAVRALLTDPSPTSPRLVTLTGPGGVGKTRLAVEAAARSGDVFPDGVWLVELAGLDRIADRGGEVPMGDVVHVVAAALGIRTDATTGPQPAVSAACPMDRLADSLGAKRTLLVLDNCEHVVDAVADVAGMLLARAPGLRVLTTSQEPLGISGEVLRPVPPLGVPDAADTDLDRLRDSAAVRLFVARAAGSVPGFALDTSNAAAIAAICRGLDGIPLALELAATRVRVLGVHDLAARLDDRFRVLAAGKRDAPARQRTLRAMIDWSWELLGDAERAVLRRLAVHADGCTLESAEAVCAGDGVPEADVLDVLARLVDRSLVAVVDAPTGIRYRLLESVAAYCLERLADTGEAADVRLRHALHHVEFAETAATYLRGHGQRLWLERFDAESANLRAALECAVRQDRADLALRLVVAPAWYWFLRGRLAEAMSAFDLALAAAGDRGCRSGRAVALTWQACFALHSGSPDGPVRADEMLGRVDEIDDPGERAYALWLLTLALYGAKDLGSGGERVDRTLAAFEELGDRWGTAAALAGRSSYRFMRGDYPAAAEDAHRALAIFRELGDRWGQLRVGETLAALAEIAEDYDEAAHVHHEGLRMAEELGLWMDASYKWSGLGRIALLTRDYARSREYHERGRAMAAEQSHKRGEHFAEIGLALVARREGCLEEAEGYLLAWLEWLREVYGASGNALVMAELGFIDELRGDAGRARSRHLQGYASARQSGDPRSVALALEGLAGVQALVGRCDQAARLLGRAAAARESVGVPLAKA
ncbi:MAG: AAA family ATPase, partial [Streptomycetaceae bacterium]|nr:AAA family ATPase [Streptomycetaceae bacterium]